MNRKILGICIVFLLVAMFVTPVLAKTKTSVYVKQAGGIIIGTAETTLETPNDRIHLLWGVNGAGLATLYQEDQVTVIDTFATSSEINIKGKDSATLGFMDGVMIVHLKMLWESNTQEDSGFEGVAQWRATDDTPHVVTINAVYQGFGYYQGQTLQISGTWAPVVGQVYTGTLLS